MKAQSRTILTTFKHDIVHNMRVQKSTVADFISQINQQIYILEEPLPRTGNTFSFHAGMGKFLVSRESQPIPVIIYSTS